MTCALLCCRLCPLANSLTKVTQACLNQTLLHEVSTGTTRFDLESLRTSSMGTQIYEFTLALPSYTCENCVMQWKYNTGKEKILESSI